MIEPPCERASKLDEPPKSTRFLVVIKIPSHEMFKELADKGVKIDLVYLDGRLGQQDVEPLNKIIHERTVFVMDDFECVEKGVANAMMLESTSRVLIYPREGRRTAMSIPLSILQIVPQEAT